jgi:hypothetical protein
MLTDRFDTSVGRHRLLYVRVKNIFFRSLSLSLSLSLRPVSRLERRCPLVSPNSRFAKRESQRKRDWQTGLEPTGNCPATVCFASHMLKLHACVLSERRKFITPGPWSSSLLELYVQSKHRHRSFVLHLDKVLSSGKQKLTFRASLLTIIQLIGFALEMNNLTSLAWS